MTPVGPWDPAIDLVDLEINTTHKYMWIQRPTTAVSLKDKTLLSLWNQFHDDFAQVREGNMHYSQYHSQC